MKKRAIVCLVLLAAAVQAQDKKISDLTSGSPVQATDMIPIARGGANFRLAGNDFLMWSSGTGDVPATGALGTFYYETDVNDVYTYPSTDTETWLLSIAAGQTAGRLFQTSATDVLAEITPTDETVLVSNGTTWEKKTLPDCDDTGGNHLNYDTGTNVFSCGTSGGSASFDSTNLEYMEDFLTVESLSSGAIGTHGLGLRANGGSFARGGPLDENPGMGRLSTGAGSGTSESLLFGINSTSPFGTNTLGDNDWDLDGVIIPGTDSTTIASAGWYFGFNYSYGVSGSSAGIYIRYDTARSDSTYAFVVCDAGGGAGCDSNASAADAAVVASTITPVAGTRNRLRIRHRNSGVGGNETIYMRVNDETEKTFCSSGCDADYTDVPASPSFFVLGIITNTTAIKTMDMDYLYIKISGLARY